jgi:hypothetical protein
VIRLSGNGKSRIVLNSKEIPPRMSLLETKHSIYLIRGGNLKLKEKAGKGLTIIARIRR